MALETVVGHDAAQIGVAHKEDTHQVVDLALVPIGALVQADYRGYGRGFVGVGLDADAGVVAHAEEVIDDLEALVASGEVDGCDVADLGELGGGVV